MIKRLLTGMFVLSASAGDAQPMTPTDYDRFMPQPGVPGRDVAREYIRYGDLSGQEMWFRPARGDAPAPLVVVIDDIYWRDGQRMSEGYLAGFVFERGYASVSVHARGHPEPEAPDVMADLAAALARLGEEAGERGVDMSRLILVGRGSAAWAAALLATDPSHAAAAGIDFSAIRGAILINGDGLDLIARAQESPRLRSGYFDDFFGEDDAALPRYSPAEHLGPPDAPSFLLLVEERRGSAQASAHRFAERLSAAAVAHAIVTIERHRRDSGTGEIGAPRNSATPALERFMAGAFVE